MMRSVVALLFSSLLLADASFLSKRKGLLLNTMPQKLHPIDNDNNAFSIQNNRGEFTTSTAQSTILFIRGGSLTPNSVKAFFNVMDYMATVLFAFSGALIAGKKGMDLLGMIIVATVTSCGGGTLRDVMLDSGIVFWMKDAIYLQICIGVTLLTYFLWPTMEEEFGWHGSELIVCTADAAGLAAFAVVGAQKAEAQSMHPLIWVVTGLLSACFGGVVRDLLCLQPPRIMYPYRTLYAPPAVLGAALYTGLVTWVSLETHIAASIAFLVAFVARVKSFNNPQRLPHWKLEKL